jgi:ubiquinone/menaquinone biosynthesis C-methylase UbiE
MKAVLRRVPWLYRLLQRSYYGLLYAGERVFGSRVHQWAWRFGHSVSPDDLAATLTHPHREPLQAALGTFAPITSALEVGSNAGANLILLARRAPAARLIGIDVSDQAVALGRDWVRREGLTGITLETATTERLRTFADASFDVVFSDAVLMYLGPDDIAGALREMCRIARRGVVLNEWALPAEQDTMHFWYDWHWVHNYARLLRQIPAVSQIESTRVPPEIWSDAGGWLQYGTTLIATVDPESRA